MVTKREIYAIIAGYGLGKVLPAGSTARAAKRTVITIARPAGRLAIGLAKRHPGVAAVSGLVAAHELGYLDPVYERAKPIKKKAMTKFNRAVKKGMEIVKDSASYGKKGIINSPKKAFTAVTKAVSKARKGEKLSVKGVLRKVQQKAKEILGKEVTRRKKFGKGPAGKLAEMKYRLRLRK